MTIPSVSQFPVGNAWDPFLSANRYLTRAVSLYGKDDFKPRTKEGGLEPTETGGATLPALAGQRPRAAIGAPGVANSLGSGPVTGGPLSEGGSLPPFPPQGRTVVTRVERATAPRTGPATAIQSNPQRRAITAG